MSSSEKPLISIAMCTYNGERFLAEQLQSILDQTYSPLEIIIVDDCSTDGTRAIVSTFMAKDARIRLIENETNVGFVRNFERALLACAGTYISLADQDDIWLPEKVQRLHEEIANHLLIYSNVELIDENGKRLGGRFPSVNRIDGQCALSLVLDNCVTGHACLMHRDLLALALPMPKALFAHDQWLAIAAAASGRLKASEQVLSLYRKHGGNAILHTKSRHKPAKHEKNAQKIQKILTLVDAMLTAGLLSGEEKTLLNEFRRMLARNGNVFYNIALADFLSRHQDSFLRLYAKPEKAIRKICRGYWFYRLLPFA